MQESDIEVFLKDYREEIHRSAWELLPLAVPDVTEELFAEFERTGSRLGYESIYFTRRKYLAILGMEAILCAGEECDDTERLTEKLCSVIESVCDEETWALPAHVNRKVCGWQITVDLFASETAQTLANLMDELWDELSEAVKLRIQEEIRRRVLEPFFESEVPYSWWEGSEMNWNAVCAGGIGSVCIHFYHRGLALPEEFSSCMRRVCDSLTCYIDGFADDGACMEGLGYYTYGMAYYVNFMREREDICAKAHMPESDVPKAHMPAAAAPEFAGAKHPEKLRRIAAFPGKCFFSDGRSVSFSDGDSRDAWRVGIQSSLAVWFDDLTFPNIKSAAGVHADSCYRFVNLKMDVFETERYLLRAEEKENTRKNGCETAEQESARTEKSCARADIFPDAQWCIAESANGVGFACKGGHNDEPHNHNDIGHFIYEAGGMVFLADLGAGEYTADYFGDRRYEILCNRSAGHSVPVLNGENQKNGRDYCCGKFSAFVEKNDGARRKRPDSLLRDSSDEPAGMEKAGDGGKILSVRMEIGSAWPRTDETSAGMQDVSRKTCGEPAPAASVIRTFRFDLRTGSLTMEDTFDRSLWETVTETLITQIRPHVDGSRVFLRNADSMAVIHIQGASEKAISGKQKIRVKTLEHRNHSGKAEPVYAICLDAGELQTVSMRLEII